MIQDKHVKVTYRNNNGGTEEITITVTGQQIGQTVSRRMNTLMPTAKVLDMAEVTPDSVQLDHTTQRKGVTK